MTTRLLAVLASIAFAALGLPLPARAMSDDMAGMRSLSHGRYYGKPDLGLLSATVAAAGGPRHFSSVKLLTMLTAQQHAAEVARLDARFGAERVTRSFATFDSFFDDALGYAQRHGIRLPRPDPALASNPFDLAESLRAAGVMPDGRFDVGYFIEHLISRPAHVAVMRQVDHDPNIGPAWNADLHVILTAEMDDLRSLYHLPK